MKVKIISSFGENVFEIPEEKVWAVLQEAAKQSKTNTSENSDQPSASQEHPVSQKEELEPESEKSRKTLECYIEKQRQNRVDNLFGSAWREKIPDVEAQTTEPSSPVEEKEYSGFLLIKCDKCGKVKAFCSKGKMTSYNCDCGHETHLNNLRPLYLRCKCGSEFKYKTNFQTSEFTHNCLSCGKPVNLRLNSRKTAYVTIGGVLIVTMQYVGENTVHHCMCKGE